MTNNLISSSDMHPTMTLFDSILNTTNGIVTTNTPTPISNLINTSTANILIPANSTDAKLYFPKSAGTLIISDVQTYNDRVVKVTFADGTFTKSVCSENDKFDLDVGITICLVKRMMAGDHPEEATKKYNNLIRNIHAMMKEKEIAKAEERKLKEQRKRKLQKAKNAKIAKRIKHKSEMQDIYKNAMLEAMKEYDTGKTEEA